jgi:hypothetical protein
LPGELTSKAAEAAGLVVPTPSCANAGTEPNKSKILNRRE